MSNLLVSRGFLFIGGASIFDTGTFFLICFTNLSRVSIDALGSILGALVRGVEVVGPGFSGSCLGVPGLGDSLPVLCLGESRHLRFESLFLFSLLLGALLPFFFVGLFVGLVMTSSSHTRKTSINV